MVLSVSVCASLVNGAGGACPGAFSPGSFSAVSVPGPRRSRRRRGGIAAWGQERDPGGGTGRIGRWPNHGLAQDVPAQPRAVGCPARDAAAHGPDVDATRAHGLHTADPVAE